jgi:hypothetical protein
MPHFAHHQGFDKHGLLHVSVDGFDQGLLCASVDGF